MIIHETRILTFEEVSDDACEDPTGFITRFQWERKTDHWKTTTPAADKDCLLTITTTFQGMSKVIYEGTLAEWRAAAKVVEAGRQIRQHRIREEYPYVE